MSPAGDTPHRHTVEGERLESWKAIAAYLNRSVTTVQRWERDEGLPVHRLQHDALGSLYAFKHELDRWREGRSTSERSTTQHQEQKPVRAIAVLPFSNLAADPDQEYLADAMIDALITALARTGGVEVASRTSVMQYKHVRTPIKEIARSLRVDAVIEGSVLRVGDRVRVTAQLIDAVRDRHVWAESYDGDMRDILALQRDIARAVAAEIGTIIRDRHPDLRPRVAVSPGAYDAYVRGMFHLHKFRPEGYERALSCFQQALDVDPNDPLAWAGRAFAYGMISHSDLPACQPHDAFAEVRAAALRALDLDEGAAEAHAALAGVKLYYDWDWQGAARELQRALELNPMLAEAHRHYGWYFFLRDLPDRGLAELKRARDAEPLTPLYAAELGWAYWMVGQPGEARCEALRALELDPDFAIGHFVYGALMRDDGRCTEALAAHERAAKISRGWRWALGETYATFGLTDLARQMLASWTDGTEPEDAWDAFTLAYVSSALDDRDEAVRGVEALYKQRHGWTPWVCRGVMAFGRIADDPRFQQVANRLSLPE